METQTVKINYGAKIQNKQEKSKRIFIQKERADMQQNFIIVQSFFEKIEVL
jgi:hypothetical protein